MTNSHIINIKLIDKKKEKFAVYLSDGTHVEVTGELILRHNLKRGLEVSAEDVRNLLYEDELISARTLAIAYLSLKVVSAKQVRDYLRRKNISAESIEHVISELREKGKIDDTRFAQLFIKDRLKLKPAGPLKLMAELKQKGVADHIIESAITPVRQHDTQKNLALKLARKKMPLLARYDRGKQRQKLSSFLRQKGFEPLVIAEVMRQVLTKDNEDVYE